MEPKRLPRENLVRAMPRGSVELRATENGDMPVMAGHFAVFNEWTRIDSVFEGTFMERIAPKSFAKTFDENRDVIKVTFNHGHDPSMGDKVLGPIEMLSEDRTGAAYAVPLLDTSYNRDLLPGLEAGLYGSSFRFRVLREDVDNDPGASDHNPDNLPERTIREAEVFEFGPVTFPAYGGATAGVRSMTDEFIFDGFTNDPKRLVELIDNTRALTLKSLKGEDPEPVPAPDPAPAEATPEPVSVETSKEENVTVDIDRFTSLDDLGHRRGEVQSRMEEIQNEYGVRAFTTEAQTEFEELTEERTAIDARVADVQKRLATVATNGADPAKVEKPVDFQVRKAQPQNIYDKAAVYRDARSPENASELFRDNAMRTIEGAVFPHERANQAEQKGNVEKLLKTSDTADAEIARRILTTGNPTYRRAFGKAIKAGSLDTLTNEERTVMAEGAGATGGFAITFDLDPTIVRTSNGAVNPFRRACRVVSISGTNEWRGVSSGAVVATYEAEATEAVDRSPTLAQPAFITNRAQTFIPFSIELDQDWGGLQGELAGLIQDSKDTLEAAQFATGVGTTVFPQGITVGATVTATTGTTTVLAVNDIYKTEEALPPRFRPRAQWFANRFIYNKVRQLDTAGGANLWVNDLRTGLPSNETGNTGYNLIGYPANEASGMAASLATTTKLAVLGDPNFFVIVERVGLDIELIPHLFGTTANYPSGQRGIYAMWRNTGRVLNAAGFVTLVGL
jgi:HK97 family phage major capsid protein/HK97 family phage prohead protease